MFSAFLKDLRVSLRTLRSNPGFALVALLSLGLGIGANTAIFSVMDALLYRSLPVSHPEELVFFGDGRAAGVGGGFPDRPPRLFSLDFYKHLTASQKVFTSAAAVSSLRADAHGRIAGAAAGTGLEPIQIRLVSGNYFNLLGVNAAAGRVFSLEDDVKPGGHPLLVMSHTYWQKRFGGDPQAVGRTIAVNGTVYTLIGAASKGFTGTIVGESPDLWAPLSMHPQLQAWINNAQEPLTQFTWIIGRLAPGVTRSEALAQSNVLYRQWLEKAAGPAPSQEQRDAMPKARIEFNDAARGASQLRRQYAEPLQILMAMVGIVLLIASANVANLLLARISARQREIAVRIALGATRLRLMSQLLTESVLMSFLGGAVGLILAWWSAPFLVAMVSSEPRALALDVSPQPTVLLFTFALCLLTGLVSGVGPSWRMTRGSQGIPGLQEGKGTVQSGSRGLAGRLLVVAQVAMAMVLTAGAGWFIQTLQKIRATDPGFETERVLLVQLDPEASGLQDKALQQLAKRLEERIIALPGVRSASYTALRFDGGRWGTQVWKEGVERTSKNGLAFDGNVVGATYFDTMGMQIRQGRGFSPTDQPKSEIVAVINETMARKLFPEGSPVGHVFTFNRDENVRIAGVVSDAKIQNPREETNGMFFLYNSQRKDGYQDIVVRASGNPAELAPRLRALIQSEEPNLAIVEITTLGELVERSLTQEKLLSKLAALFGGLALLLSAIGIYGVLAYAVARRTNEIGVRMALGASPGDVLTMVLRESLLVVGIGALLGIPATIAMGRLVATQLYGLTPNDPWTIAGSAAVLVLTAVAASAIPSNRAARLDPLTALREN